MIVENVNLLNLSRWAFESERSEEKIIGVDGLVTSGGLDF